ncbi:hypothetical protein WH47_00885 [Habropoda laboriosa]|uniref:Uncharacterized protein n=1 Tax=Habropoda laboriosa TaxID=597456 RepID=A0A0L7R7D9_9HYME|nr:hypothetical protein WH47_00885 [Habropoda laboriosa]
MTRCNKSEINLKSTAYNQDGQNYFEQLTAYNSMSAHLRRILLAKCVVDARNKNYMNKRKQLCKQIDCKPRLMKTEITNNIIDKLAYDTLYHPADFLRMYHDSKYLCQCEAERYFTNYYDDVICPRSKLHDHVICPSLPTFKINNSEPFISNCKNTKRHKVFSPLGVKTMLKMQNRYEENSIFHGSASDFLSQEINHLSSAVNTTRSCDNYETTQVPAKMIHNQEVHVRNEEVKYAKFVYEITREIILNELYTDKQLQEVFTKHMEENKKILDMNTMLYEIYQLKLALNISENPESGKLTGVAYTQQQLNVSEIRPQSSSEILNENKATEKFVQYQKMDENRRDLLGTSNIPVVLIDANPELIVTTRDVLTSLIEADINPEQARKIYRKLSDRSKDTSPLVR